MQLEYTNDVPKGFDGQVASAVAQTRITALPTEDVKPGKMLCSDNGAGTVDKSARYPTGAGDVVTPLAMGIVIRQETRQSGEDYPAGQALALLTKGHLFIKVEDAVTKRTHAYVRHTATGAEVLGSLRSDADGTDAAINTGITFLESVGAGEICRVAFDL